MNENNTYTLLWKFQRYFYGNIRGTRVVTFVSHGTDILPRLSPLYRVVKKLNAIIQTVIRKMHDSPRN